MMIKNKDDQGEDMGKSGEKINLEEMEVELYSSTNEYEIGQVCSILSDNSIPFIRRDCGSGAYMNLYFGQSIQNKVVIVNIADYDRARELIAIFLDDKSDDESEEAIEDKLVEEDKDNLENDMIDEKEKQGIDENGKEEYDYENEKGYDVKTYNRNRHILVLLYFGLPLIAVISVMIATSIQR